MTPKAVFCKGVRRAANAAIGRPGRAAVAKKPVLCTGAGPLVAQKTCCLLWLRPAEQFFALKYTLFYKVRRRQGWGSDSGGGPAAQAPPRKQE